MEEIIYVVTAGCYSDYSIKAVFKDKTKAEFYCTCHKDCKIEDYSLSDNNIFTPFESVLINFDIFIGETREDRINFNFQHLSKEDEGFYLINRDEVTVYSNEWISIYLNRRLPDNYDREEIESKYTKVYQDLRAEILYLLSESDCSTFEKRKEVGENINNYIKGRFGIELGE